MSRSVPIAPPLTSRAWWVLLGFASQRHARGRQLVFIALAMLILGLALVAAQTSGDGWDFSSVPNRPRTPDASRFGTANPMLVEGMQATLAGALRVESPQFGFANFSRWVVFSMFLGFFMPMWTLSFATSAMGVERESRSFIWLMTRPLPRWSIYLAHYLAVLPWCLMLNLGGFTLLCYAGGSVGREAFAAYWPAVLAGTPAFAALFHLIGAMVRRPAVIALLYSFFFETLAGDLPWTLKRLSVSFYTRCIMYDAALERGFSPARPEVFLPVSSMTAWLTLIGVSVTLTLFGMWAFDRTEAKDDL